MFKKTAVVLLSLALLLTAGLTRADEKKREVLVATVDGVINPVTAEFLGKSIKKANEMNAEALVIELDTPGGLDTSMRAIIKDMLGSDVPVVVFVAPSGARAASAGTFITIAANIAAMAPQTNIGAAHPVGVGGQIDETMQEKVVNDAAAYIKSLAEKRGRNVQWAEDAVRKSISATEEEALKKHVIDLVTRDVNTLLVDMDGRNVQTAAGERVLHTAGATVIREEMGWRYRILDLISNPNVAYILMLLGFYGLFFELTSPGAIFPGVLGGICLILAFYAFQTLPVNYAGLLLIILAIVLFILEVKIVSHGVLTIGGVISLAIGSIMLFETGPFLTLSLHIIIPAVLVTTLFFTLTIGLVVRAHRRKPVTGQEGLIGEKGTATTEITAEGGLVKVAGELWSAYSEEPMEKGQKVVVEAVTGLKVKVRKLNSKEV
jgi:membrane-bound serine protease (ClpP class)